MRNEVLHFFRNMPESKTAQFNKAFELYRQSEGKNLATERSYNAHGYNDLSLGNLLYDLQKLHNISDIEKLPVEEPGEVQSMDEPTLLDKLCFKVIGSDDPYIMQSLKLHLEAPDFTYPDSASDNLTHFLHIAAANLSDFFNAFKEEHGIDDHITPEQVAEKLKVELSEVVFPEEISEELELLLISDAGTEPIKEPAAPADETFSLREQYPFLNDADCPNELKILVADKITHYNNYRGLHERLQTADVNVVGSNQITAWTKESVEAFEASEAIGVELDHYRDNKTLLAKHPIFAKLALQREVDEMTQAELNKFREQTPSYMSKKIKLQKEAKTDERKEELQAAINNRNAKLALVNKKLGINAG